MPKLIVVTRDGAEHELEGAVGYSVMETIRESGIDEILALCGGCCSCATCHVFVDPAWAAAVGPPKANESDLLEGSDQLRPESRLSCQIRFANALDGLKVTIAPEDW